MIRSPLFDRWFFVFGRGQEQHNKGLKLCYTVYSQQKLHWILQSVRFLKTRLSSLVTLSTKMELEPADPDKTRAVVKLPPPSNVKEMHGLLVRWTNLQSLYPIVLISYVHWQNYPALNKQWHWAGLEEIIVIRTGCGVYGNYINHEGPGCSARAQRGRY